MDPDRVKQETNVKLRGLESPWKGHDWEGYGEMPTYFWLIIFYRPVSTSLDCQGSVKTNQKADIYFILSEKCFIYLNIRH